VCSFAILTGILSAEKGQLKGKSERLDTATVDAESNCVLFDTISKFSHLLHIVRLPYDGQLSVS